MTDIDHHSQIARTLHATCHAHAITPLHAIESGSRAWGFASFDSDFDVRLIYHHTPDWYLQIYDGKDTFEFINHDLFDVPFDIGGWDIKKVLVHIHKSNAVIFEWLNSPIIYHSNDDFVQSLKKIQSEFFNPKTVYHHYQGMAKKANGNLDLTCPIKLKKWCYIIRALLASLWIKEYQSIPPVCMNKMFNLLTNDDVDELNYIISLKQSYDESYPYQLPKSMQKLTQHLWQNTQHLTFNKKTKGDVGVLNDLFRKIVLKTI
ncbi:MAG: nucleotidyltransferase domain-containing protein [Moraxella sp.]|nr:nucleotidyltransferase domain-containing protein [Moraxella sp.]